MDSTEKNTCNLKFACFGITAKNSLCNLVVRNSLLFSYDAIMVVNVALEIFLNAHADLDNPAFLYLHLNLLIQNPRKNFLLFFKTFWFKCACLEAQNH